MWGSRSSLLQHATCMRRFCEAVHALWGLRLEELHVVDRAPRQARVYGRLPKRPRKLQVPSVPRACPKGRVHFLDVRTAAWRRRLAW